ncbi:hypothetical protein SDC9_209473 [bioreactor metagenome]|uniref:Uncharacterized protein n=1 Tax=bioreactor metagenome TaxID=1076179 RepID=A0A645JDR6_9ZZZZ
MSFELAALFGVDEIRIERPVFLGDEIAYLLLTLGDHPHRNGLDASGGETAAYLFPKQRR